MNDESLYAQQWDVSSKYFYEKGHYHWMASKIGQFSTVLEIGCGTGYGTVALIEKGFDVISIDKNAVCIERAKALIDTMKLTDKVQFITGDIADDTFRKNLLNDYSFDVVICWNVGTYWNREMMQYYLPYMLEYGLTISQIKQNPESSYSELVIWETCRIAKLKGVAAHIVDRGAETVTAYTDPYYKSLKTEFGFSRIEYDNRIADSISDGGRILSTNGVVNGEKKVDIVFVPILLK